jgi:anti-sigma factor RsiW
MQCERVRQLTDAYADGELYGDDRHAVAVHLASCPSCAGHADDLSVLGRQLASSREPMPAQLVSRVRTSLEQDGARNRHTWLAWPARRQQAAILAAACIVTALVTWGWTTGSERHARVEHDVLAAHIRSLLQSSPTQIASADTHAVKPWFTGRLDFAPTVKDLTAEGFPLIGGRVDYVAERRVGTLVYRRRQHVINVFLWPAAGAERTDPRVASLKGYNAVAWSAGGMTYWAISDLNAGELMQLPGLL